MTTEAPIELYVSGQVAGSAEVETLLESVRSASGCSVEFAEDLTERYSRHGEVGGWLSAVPFELIVVIPLNSLAAAVSDAAVAWARERVKKMSRSIEVTIYAPPGFFPESEVLSTVRVEPPKEPRDTRPT
jgi:hypothetical protein